MDICKRELEVGKEKKNKKRVGVKEGEREAKKEKEGREKK